MKKNKKIAYITGGRMDFGLMLSTLKKIEASPKLSLQVYYTGVHLIPEFGNTQVQVLKEFPNAKKINVTYKKDDKASSPRFIGEFINLLTKEFISDKPDLVLVLGDRAEMLGGAIASLYLGIPTAQIHAGDKTKHVDEVVRHAISKLSHLFFVANKDSYDRLVKLGEDKWRIHLVGAPAIDLIKNDVLPSRQSLFNFLNLKTNEKFILILYHPTYDELENVKNNTKIIIEAVNKFDIPKVIIYPNTDIGGREIINLINKEKNSKLFRIFANIDHKMFLALEREASVWITNSSAGIIESSSFHTPVINIGLRQNGRPQSGNVINISFDRGLLTNAINKSLFDKKYLKYLRTLKNIWGDGRTSEKIVKAIEKNINSNKLLLKQITY